MRIDPQLHATGLGINSRQHYFIGAWLNLIHQYSLDSYRVRVMNPLNILQELRHMFDAHASDADRRVVAEEALEIFRDHPVIAAHHASYPGNADLQSLLKEAVQAKENGFKKNQLLLMSFLREFESALQQRFLADCFTWMGANLSALPPGETFQERERNHAHIQRVARDLLSAAHGSGFSLASLFQLYRHFISREAIASSPAQPADEPTAEALEQPVDGLAQAQSNYDFTERFARVRNEILAAPKSHSVIFAISGVRKPDVAAVSGTFGAITISATFPPDAGQVPSYALKRFSPAAGRLFASAEVTSRDGRSAGLDAFRQVGQILDLMRFEYDTRAVEIDSRFLLRDGEELRLLELPQLIPNPEADPPTRKLEDFVVHLDQLSGRGIGLAEAKDRIFSAFRLYRVGTSVSMFENKLVNWWTALEYLASGIKSGGNGIGPAVRDAIAPVLALSYLPKLLTAFRIALTSLDAEVSVDGQTRKVRDCTNVMLYRALKDVAQRPALEARCAGEPFLWSHLSTFMDNISTPAKTASMLKVHDQRVRWQIERIYRARCDIVHAGGQVPMAGLLCANLEFYLRMTLKAMLKVFGDVPTLTGPAEFFERQRHQFVQVASALAPTGNAAGSDNLLIETMA